MIHRLPSPTRAVRRSTFVHLRRAIAVTGLAAAFCAATSAGPLRIATFRCDATPPAGEPLVWAMPLKTVVMPLLVKGVLLEDSAGRYVICSIDWCLVGNESELLFRRSLAAGAQTDPGRVAIHSVHQHAAPCGDEGANRLLAAAPQPLPTLSATFLHGLRARMTQAVADAVARLQPFDQIGTGVARVERVASYRRMRDTNGKLVSRVSTAGKNKAMAEMPEGDIDPEVQTITFALGGRPLARLHYYATHPQTFCCDGRASWDFVGDAREALEREEKVPQIYFSACGSDVTVGKYNDTTTRAYDELTARLKAGLKASTRATRFAPADRLVWRTVGVTLPLRDDRAAVETESRAWLNDPTQPEGMRVYRGAMRLAFVERLDRPIEVSSLQIGDTWVVHLPGEPMLEFQRFARSLRPADFVAVAGYGDCGPAYICTDQAIAEGSYEPSASNVGAGSEARLKQAIRQLLGADTVPAARPPPGR